MPRLDVIPENPGLIFFEKRIKEVTKREYVLKKYLIDQIKDKYEVIFFDNSPSWSQLIENSLVASNVVISPVGCDLGSYLSIKTNLHAVESFKNEMEMDWDTYLLVPTLLEKNNMSNQILRSYYDEYEPMMINSSIKRSLKGQEAISFNLSVFEHDPRSDISAEYFDVITEVWNKILESERVVK